MLGEISGRGVGLDVVQNMYLGREVRDVFWQLKESTMEARTAETLKSLSVTTIRSSRQLVASLSGGQRQSVAIGRAVMWNSRIVILDEPTGTMDPITKVDVKHSIMHSREEMDETFIVVSHDMEFVRDICDRLALMRGGKIIQIGKTADVLAILTEEEKKVMSQPQA